MGRPLRADAARSVRAILEAAEHVLAEDPGASMEQIAEQAGVARTTVHRRFANRQALIEALAASAKQQLMEAMEDAHLDTAPPLVALHRATANALRIKSVWRFTLGHPLADTPLTAVIWSEINAGTLEFLARAQREGLLAPEADLMWARRVYYALVDEALHGGSADLDPDQVRQNADALATLVVDTFLRGMGPHG
ncbi:TetR/AcrR family transcriptional regulator [Streptomyces sp. NBC_01373]|uniref:TetR/AcrR family transcriptional regulator n=1 Tax=unclassified Streptomyces TaxID=2593676 RepID=UPI0022554EF7|nr:TetR/AcrR family transcriptional regulator [Streptomyces sp. NBC_01373]MCX4705475.1 TetR/AcrR family transcriptional regulator [Streptomyces sp. NBC_01373]